MSQYKREESEINIKDVFFAVLKNLWLMVLVGAVIGGGFGFKKITQKVKTNDVLDITTKLSSSETDVQYDLRKQNISRARTFVDMIEKVNNQIAHQRAYISDSIYMQIDAENVCQSNAQVVISLDDSSEVGLESTLFSAYERDIKAGNFLNEYAESIGTEPDYIKELISFTYSNNVNTVISLDGNMDSVGSMYIGIYGPETKFCDDVMDLMIDEMMKVNGELNKELAPHTISVVGVHSYQRIDNGIRDGQINQTAKIDTLQRQIVSYNDSLDKVAEELGLSGKEDILEYFAVKEEVTVDGIPTETSEKYISRWTMLKPAIKRGILGFAGGFVLVAAFFLLKYFFWKKFSNQAQFFAFFPRIKKIGVMKPTGKNTPYRHLIDCKADDDTKLSTEINNKIISANYDNITRDMKKVLITGTAEAKALNKVVKDLKLNGDVKPDFFSNPDVIRSIPDYDCVVLVEQRNHSVTKNVIKEIELVNNSGKQVAGAIIL